MPRLLRRSGEARGERGRRGERGQSMVEFCIVLPTFLVLVLGVAEMGFAVGQNMSLELGTREGARVGASLGNGATLPLGPSSVDPQIIASVERALISTGANVSLGDIVWVRIYESDASGNQGPYNEWRYSAGVNNVGGVSIHFTQVSNGWTASSRSSALPAPDSVGVSIRYRYHMQTPLGALVGLFGANEFLMTDSTVMAVQPAG